MADTGCSTRHTWASATAAPPAHPSTPLAHAGHRLSTARARPEHGKSTARARPKHATITSCHTSRTRRIKNVRTRMALFLVRLSEVDGDYLRCCSNGRIAMADVAEGRSKALLSTMGARYLTKTRLPWIHYSRGLCDVQDINVESTDVRRVSSISPQSQMRKSHKSEQLNILSYHKLRHVLSLGQYCSRILYRPRP